MITSGLLILPVLLHKGRGGGLSDMFGGGVPAPSAVLRRGAQPRPAHGRDRRHLVRLRRRPGLLLALLTDRSRKGTIPWLVEETLFAVVGQGRPDG